MPNVSRLDEAVEFAENPEPRCPCVLLLDTSGSMQGAAIDALNHGLSTFRADLSRDPLAARRVEVAVVSFNNKIEIVRPFVTVDRFQPPQLSAKGQTYMGTAIQHALDLIETRKATYRAHGVFYYRPWIFMITDGEPQGEPAHMIEQATAHVRTCEDDKRVAFFAVGVEQANMEKLAEIAVRKPVKLAGLNFADMFLWLSASMQAISHSRVNDQVALPPPGWGEL